MSIGSSTFPVHFVLKRSGGQARADQTTNANTATIKFDRNRVKAAQVEASRTQSH